VQGSNELFKVEMPLARLSLISQRSDTPRGQVHPPSRFHAALHRDMFSLCWGPLVRAVAALLEACNPDDTAIITDGMVAMRAVRASHDLWRQQCEPSWADLHFLHRPRVLLQRCLS
jgi:hypothetical protein